MKGWSEISGVKVLRKVLLYQWLLKMIQCMARLMHVSMCWWCRLLSCTEGGKARLHKGTWQPGSLSASQEAGTDPGSGQWTEVAEWQAAKVPVCCSVCAKPMKDFPMEPGAQASFA